MSSFFLVEIGGINLTSVGRNIIILEIMEKSKV